jgi:hypothetical protein
MCYRPSKAQPKVSCWTLRFRTEIGCKRNLTKAIEGAGDIMFTGRKMGGLIDVTDDAFIDDDRRAIWMGMALRHAQSLPPKS